MSGGPSKNAYAHTESRLVYTHTHTHTHTLNTYKGVNTNVLYGAYNICFCFCLLDRQNLFTSRRVWRRKHGGLAASMVDYGNCTLVKSAQDIETNCTHN